MIRILCAGVLLFALSGFAQQPGPYGSPPRTTPPTFPSDQAPRVSPSPNDQTQQTPRDQTSPFPPDVAPQTERPASAALERTLQNKLAAEPILKNADLDVRVTERDVTVSGTVDDQRQHDAALKVVQSNAGDRHVVDKMKVRS